MIAKKQVIAILFAAFLIMLCLSVKAKNNSTIAEKNFHCPAQQSNMRIIEMNLPPILILTKYL